MKRFFTFLMALALIVSAVNAQQTRRQLPTLKVTASEIALEQKTLRTDVIHPALQPAVSKMPTVIISNSGVTPSQLVRASNATTLFSSDFSNAAVWSITNDNATTRNWVIGTAGPSGSYAIPKINSTTASNGFALLDSDKLNAACKSNLTNATAIDCTGQPVVYLAFETYLRKFQDHFYIKVSNDGTTWTTTEIFASLAVNGSSENAELVVMDISSVAANKATVYVRFYYESAAGGDYAWMVDDVQVVAGVIYPKSVLKTANFGGFWSGTNDTVYTSEVKYWGSASNSTSHLWNFDASATNITPLTDYLPDYEVTSVTYTTSGEYTATLNAVGVDGNNYSNSLTRKVVIPYKDMEDYVWNIAPEDLYTYYTFSTGNYVYGANSYYKIIGERYELPQGVTALVDELDYWFGYYRTTSQATKACSIKIYEEDPVTKLPGTLKGTISSNFGALFGTTNVTNGNPTGKYVTFTPIEVTGPFYVVFELTGIGTTSSTNYFSFVATSDRLFPESTVYVYYNNAWAALNDFVTGGARSSLFFMPYLTITNVPLAIASRNPDVNAVNVPLDAEVSVTFNQDITAGTLSGVTINGTAATATVSGNKLTIAHSNFTYSTPYEVVIPANTITGYAQEIRWSFTTVSQNVEVASITPANNATNVEINTEVSVTFNKTVTAAGTLSGITINGTAATATVSGSKLIINHSEFEYDKDYTVIVPANTITDYAQEITWTFKTKVYVGIPDVKGNDINIFQNNGGINVIVSEDSYIRILDIFGRVLGSYNVGANSTLTFTQPAGFYIIDVQSNSGIYTHKVVVR